jgi:hypothetical protein
MSAVHDHNFSPTEEAFKPRTMWSLSNAFTSAFKTLPPTKQFEVTARLGSYLSGIPGNTNLQLSGDTDDNGDLDVEDLDEVIQETDTDFTDREPIDDSTAEVAKKLAA